MHLAILSGAVSLIAGTVEAIKQPKVSPSSPLLPLEPPVCISPYLWSTVEAGNDSSGPGWQGLGSCNRDACIFSNSEIGGGLVVVTSQKNAEIISNYTAPPKQQPTPLSFNAAKVPGKGIGLIANRDIKAGEIIMVRTPTIIVQAIAHVRIDPEPRNMLYSRAIERLPKPKQNLFMSQMGNGIHGKIDTNCFQLFVDGKNETGSHLACYPEVSRFNHDCRPNLHYRINNMTHTTVAARDIAAGEELSITYIAQMHTREERQERLSRWGFNCTCAQCSLGAEEAAASDARLATIEQLEADLNVFNETRVTAETGEELVRLYHQERLYIFYGQALTRAALNFALFGDVERARVYARAAVDAIIREVGPDSKDADSMRLLAENPREHWTWGKRRKKPRDKQ